MPIVAKNSAEYLLKKQQLLKDYEDYAKMRKTYKKSADSIRESGTPFFQSMQEPKTTLETYLDKSKNDDTLFTLLVSNLGAQSGQAKQFIQGLDDNMKVNLLDRFPIFEKLFNKNFVTPKLNSLLGAFELFIKEGLYDKKIKNPSSDNITSWLNSLAPDVIQFVSNIVTNANNKFIPGRLTATAPRDVNSVLGQIAKYVNNFNNDTIGYSSLYNLLERSGLPPVNLPRPRTTEETSDTPSQLLSTPISRIVAPPPPAPVPAPVPAPPLPDPGLSSIASLKAQAAKLPQPYDEEEVRRKLKRVSNEVLIEHLIKYNRDFDEYARRIGKSPETEGIPSKQPFKITSKGEIDGRTKPKLSSLIKRKFDPDTGEFLVFSEGGSRSSADPRSAAVPEGKSQELGDLGDLGLPSIPSGPPTIKILGSGSGIIFMR